MFWDLVVDVMYLLAQFFIDTLTLLLSFVNWVCPVFPNLGPPTVNIDGFGNVWAKILSAIAWIIPWGYAAQLLIVMSSCTMFAIMTTWILRWLKVVK